MPLAIPGPADLHLHSERSDGTESPERVVEVAREAGLGTIALTDHETTSGWDEAATAARRLGMGFLPGAEISAEHAWTGVHVLAYLFDPDDANLSALMRRIRDDRVGRAERLVANLARDYPITWDDVSAQRAGDATVGRPHIADALVAAGVVSDRGEAFADLLHFRSPYYERHYTPEPILAVQLIAAAGGVPIIAHPAGRGRLDDGEIRRLIDAGLAGFELGHRENRPDGVARLRRFVDAHDLVVTGSSDYHGAGKPNRPGENTTDLEMVERIIARASGTDPIL
ncbi:PHP domain-containing protein [Microbacterium indicum]|uniref:PHP domain-containing protein n=1 Tax=Microbacterium indicum TaxID=358100 RepID=UPI0003F8C4C9|nr:PHP domain-containing protein [Microbacterium indicum]